MTDPAERLHNETPPVDRLSQIWRRLNEHKIVQWSMAYLALAYAIQHALTLTGEAFEWPRAVLRLSMLLFALGLPLVITFAWYHGARASRNFSQAELSILATLFVGVSLLFYVFVRPSDPTGTRVAQEASVTVARAAAASPKGAISVAVLPFLNLSADKDQEFFSDGMTEEITSALAKVQKLIVIGRTSAFQFKGKAQDLRAIGQALNANYLIEGSMRKAADRVRITAQLIRADTGAHLWTDSYDRELKDIFAVQEDVARAIAASLQAPLGLKQGEVLVSGRTIDTESYQDYLRARALVRVRGLMSLTDSARLLEQVVARNPGYAPAWALLSLSYDLIPNFHPAYNSGDVEETRRIVNASLPRAEAAARRTIALDSKLADGYEALGLAEAQRGDLLGAEDLYLKALALDPNHPDTLQQYSQILGEVGHIDAALAMRQRLQTLEPLVPVYNTVTASLLWLKGQNDAAIGMFRRIPSDFALGKIYSSMAYASLGRYGDAANALSELPAQSLLPGTSEEAIRLLHSAPAAAQTPQNLPRLGILEFVYLYVGAASRVLEFEEGNAEAGNIVPNYVNVLWHPSYAEVRKTQRFNNFIRKAGLVDYWRANGWPPQCHPTTGDDFECS